MIRIGAHMSIAGGLSRAVDRAVLHGCEALQIFAKNANQWRGKPLDDDDVRSFRAGVERADLHPVVSHASYLINMATANPALRAQSADALHDELHRAARLGLDGMVIHPGTCTSGTEDDALANVAAAIREALGANATRGVKVLLEHTAGQGRTIGHRFEHLAIILEHLDGDPRVGVCLDMCHLVASGYDLSTPEGYAATWASFDRLVGLDRLQVIHANDSKKPCGSRVDRHEHVGEGCLGLEPFRRVLADARLDGRAMLIETEKSPQSGRPGAVVLDPLDVRNLEMLRRLRAEAAVVPASL